VQTDTCSSDYFVILSKKFEKYSENAQKNPFIQENEVLSIKKLFYTLSNAFFSEKPVLVHNDVWYKNIL
jgi:thiamine kinase-like enzyme